MTNNQFIFWLEFNLCSTEKGFIAMLQENPEDEATKNAYMDWLTEQGRTKTAELIKRGFIPGLREEKIIIGGLTSGNLGSGAVSSEAVSRRRASLFSGSI